MDAWDPQRQPTISPGEGLVPEEQVKPAGPTQAPSGSSASGTSTPDVSTSLVEAVLDAQNLKRALQRVHLRTVTQAIGMARPWPRTLPRSV